MAVATTTRSISAGAIPAAASAWRPASAASASWSSSLAGERAATGCRCGPDPLVAGVEPPAGRRWSAGRRAARARPRGSGRDGRGRRVRSLRRGGRVVGSVRWSVARSVSGRSTGWIHASGWPGRTRSPGGRAGHEEAVAEGGDVGPVGALDGPIDRAGLDELALGGDPLGEGAEDAGGGGDDEADVDVDPVAVGLGDGGRSRSPPGGRSAGVWTDRTSASGAMRRASPVSVVPGPTSTIVLAPSSTSASTRPASGPAGEVGAERSGQPEPSAWGRPSSLVTTGCRSP